MRIYVASGTPVDGAPYLEEILRALGLCYVSRVGMDGLRDMDPASDLLLVPRGGSEEVLADFVHDGGSAIAIQPSAPVALLAGLRRVGERTEPGRLHLTAPICAAAGGQALWTLGDQTLYATDLAIEERYRSTLATLVKPGYRDSESPGIYERQVGKGMLTVFAHDPALCIKRLRQGWPEREGIFPQGETIPRSTYLHEPNEPSDTHWRPTADLHAVAFCDVVKRSLSRRMSVPTLWHFPFGKSSVLLFTGDEDAADQESNKQEMNELESCGGAMSLYVVPDDTSITLERVAEYSRRGHEISVHPNLVPTAGQSKAAQLAKARADVLRMREVFHVPVETIRNHSVMWPGYLDLPELWESLGIGLDANSLCSLIHQSPEAGPYAHCNAGLPLRFVREDGSLIDVLQQPTHVSDDLYCHPTAGKSHKYSAAQFAWVVRRILEDASQRFHVPHCPVIHPGNYTTFSREHTMAYLHYAQEMDIPIWPLDRWQNFWRARFSWQMGEYSWHEQRLSFDLTGPPCEGLVVHLPVEFEGNALSSVWLDAQPSSYELVERYWQPVAQVALTEGVQRISVVAEYSH